MGYAWTEFMEDGFGSEKFYDCVIAEHMSQECTGILTNRHCSGRNT